MKKLFLLSFIAFSLLSCNDDDSGVSVDSQGAETFRVTVSNTGTEFPIFQSGVFNTPSGEGDAGPAFPGDQYSFSFYASPGMRLSFATMLVQTNDVFIAPDDEEGILIFDENNEPINGNITSLFSYWDAGTEVNETPGSGPNQAPRQSGPDTGTEENGTVSLLSNVNDGHTYPNISDVVVISIAGDASEENLFTVTIENVSGSSSLPGPISPGAYAVHTNAVQLFENGAQASEGIERIAEDGDPSILGTFAAENTGLTTPISPGIYLVHDDGTMPLFTEGALDYNEGLENIAEDGDPSTLLSMLNNNVEVSEAGIFNTPMSASAPGPIFPGQSYSFTFTAKPGDRFNMATMLIQSNDLFIAYGDGGLALFDSNGAVEGDITSGFRIWDAGTEVNEYPGAGPMQAPRQTGPDMGEMEAEEIEEVADEFDYPEVGDILVVTIETI